MITLYNLIYKEGDTPELTITANDLAVTDLSGWTAKAQIRRSEKDSELIAEIPCQILTGTKKILIKPPGNIPYTHLPSDIPQTLRKAGRTGFSKIEKMERSSIPGKPYFWDFQLITPVGSIETFLEGAVIILREATKNA